MSFTRTDHVAATALIIDADPLMLTAIGAVLDMQGHRCVLARNESMALEAIAAGQFDVIILSIDQLHSGAEFAARLRGPDINRDLPIIFLVPELTPAWQLKLSTQGGVFCLLKPVDPYALIDLVDKALWMPHVAKGRMSAPTVHLATQSDWIKLRE